MESLKKIILYVITFYFCSVGNAFPMAIDIPESVFFVPYLYSYRGVEFLNDKLVFHIVSLDLGSFLKNLERNDVWLITDEAENIKKLFYRFLKKTP